jgi:DNA-binding response OmpR family regulator
MSKIVIIDDEQDIVELVSDNMGKEGLSIVKVYNGEAALGLVHSAMADLMIFDTNLTRRIL